MAKRRAAVIPIAWAFCKKCGASYDDGNAMSAFHHRNRECGGTQDLPPPKRTRRFEVYLDRQIAGCEPSTEVLEFADGETDAEIEEACRAALDTMIGNELDTGWREVTDESAQPEGDGS